MPCRCAERRAIIGGAIRIIVRGAPGGIGPATRMVIRTTVEDIEAMVRRMATDRRGMASGMPRRGRGSPGV